MAARSQLRLPFPLVGWVEPVEATSGETFFRATAAQLLASVPDTDRATHDHLQYLLDKVIWGATTASDKAKYNTRFVSFDVKALAEEWNACAKHGEAWFREGVVNKKG